MHLPRKLQEFIEILFRKWIKKYEDEVRDQMEAEGLNLSPLEPTETEYKKKYELAMKLLGEKELEVAVLKDALKKNQTSLNVLLHIANQWISEGFYIKRILDILGINRSTYYERNRSKTEKEHIKRGTTNPEVIQNIEMVIKCLMNK